MTQMNASKVSQDAPLIEQWDRIKGALEKLGKMYHFSVDGGSKELDDIIDYFVMKVEFDSPLAIE